MKVNIRIVASDGTITERELSLTHLSRYIYGIIKNRHVGIIISTSDGDCIEVMPLLKTEGNDGS